MAGDGEPVAAPAVNLNTVAVPRPAAGATDSGTATGVGPRVPTPDEQKRGEIASLLIYTLVGIVIVAGVAALWTMDRGCTSTDTCNALKANVESLKLVLEMVITPLVGLVGAVTGFYFGGKTAELGK